MADRPWHPPGRHWPDRPGTVAGRDDLAGGTWLGLNDHGVIAGILNRVGALGPASGFQSRGELPLLALDHAGAVDGAQAVVRINAAHYRPFNMIVADSEAAFWLRSRGNGAAVEVMEVEDGLSMMTAHDLNDPASARISYHLPRFRTAAPPAPETGNWKDWISLLESRELAPNAPSNGAMTVVTDFGFGTVSSSLMALPENEQGSSGPRWLFAAGPPGKVAYEHVSI